MNPALRPCPYTALGILSSASENEIRSAYRKRALMTHPDKGGSADAFRSVVAAFEILTDAARRSAYDRDQVPIPTPPTHKKRQQEEKATKMPSKKPSKNASKMASKAPKERTQAAPSQKQHAKKDMAYDYDGLLYKLVYTTKKKAEDILTGCSEEVIFGFSALLDDDLNRWKPKVAKLALPCPDCAKKKTVNRERSPQKSKTPFRGICRYFRRSQVSDDYVDYWASVGFNNIIVRSQVVRSLDAAIDIHISMARMREHFRSDLKAGKSFREALHEAFCALTEEREAANSPVRLVFRSRWGSRYVSKSYKDSDLDQFIDHWEEIAKRQPSPRRRLPAHPKLGAQQRRKMKQEDKAKRIREKFKAKVAWLRHRVHVILKRLELKQQRRLKKWGVKTLPQDIHVCTFLAPDDSLCAFFHLSDGTQHPGPYRKSLAEAERDLRELRRVQRCGDSALLEELHRRDTDAMTGFFMESLGKQRAAEEIANAPKRQRSAKKSAKDAEYKILLSVMYISFVFYYLLLIIYYLSLLILLVLLLLSVFGLSGIITSTMRFLCDTICLQLLRLLLESQILSFSSIPFLFALHFHQFSLPLSLFPRRGKEVLRTFIQELCGFQAPETGLVFILPQDMAHSNTMQTLMQNCLSHSFWPLGYPNVTSRDCLDWRWEDSLRNWQFHRDTGYLFNVM